jgi:hypothetical protein
LVLSAVRPAPSRAVAISAKASRFISSPVFVGS